MLDEIQKKHLQTLLTFCRKSLRSVDEKLIKSAFEFCVDAHKNDLRASGTPYYEHPLGVAFITAKEVPLDDISVAAALLHDVLEHTDRTVEDLTTEFSKEIAEIVDGVTKIGSVIKEHDLTQAENYRKMLLSMVKDIRVILVKFADRLHNMRTLEYMPPDKQKIIARETFQIYAPFAHRFGLGRIKWELEDISFKYLDPTGYENVRQKFTNTRTERESYIKKVIAPLKAKLEEEHLVFEIEGRPKSFYSIYRKLNTRVNSFEEIFDLFAIRIILETDNIYECYNVLGIITQVFTPVPDRLHDYIAIPKKNNYQSLHTTVIGPDGKMVEIQIRTRMMHEVAEKGVAAHWKYKNNLKASNQEIEEWANWIRDIFENVNNKEEAKNDIIESFKLNLYNDEIYIFTPKGDLKVLPQGATPIDFAFEIHSKVGFHCLGAKVNGRIVSLEHKLQSGDQVEILTSKNQTPNRSWEKFIVTHKAKSEIKKWIKKEEDRFSDEGKLIFEKSVKKLKLAINNDELVKLAHEVKFDNVSEMYKAIAQAKITPEKIFAIREEQKHKEQSTLEEVSLNFEKFATDARETQGGILLEGSRMDVLHHFARCCNPVPGDEVTGFITRGEGITIHRKSCRNLERLLKNHYGRVVKVSWPETVSSTFVAAIKVLGKDKVGMLNEISQTIVNTNSTNIKAVNFSTHNSIFYGTVNVFVKDLDHLVKVMDKLKKIKGIELVERFEVRN